MSSSIFSFFGLRENPFGINLDPRYLFQSPQVQTTWAKLTYGIETRKGLLLLTGEVGTGKTLLLRRLLDWLAERHMTTAYIFNSHLDIDHLLALILNDYGIPCQSSLKTEKLIALNRWLLDRYRAGDTPVVIVDEAQGLSWQVLEQIRLLLNLETPRQKLLQVVLAGQPELQEILRRPDLRQLRQRITIRCKTYPLSREQAHDYVNERLRVAGASGEPLFDQQALEALHLYSGGIPRIINLLCEHALINACAADEKCVHLHAVRQAARDCELEPLGPSPLPNSDVPSNLASTVSETPASGVMAVDPAPQPKAKAAAQTFAAGSGNGAIPQLAAIPSNVCVSASPRGYPRRFRILPSTWTPGRAMAAHPETLSSAAPSGVLLHSLANLPRGRRIFARLRNAFLMTWRNAWKSALGWCHERFHSTCTPALRSAGTTKRDTTPFPFFLRISPRFRTRVSRTVAAFTHSFPGWRSAQQKLVWSGDFLLKWFRQPLRHPRPRQPKYRPQAAGRRLHRR